MPRVIIRRREVMHRTGLSYSQVWRLERNGKFPARVQLSPFAVGWYEDEVEKWVHTRIRAGGRRLPTKHRPAITGEAEAAPPRRRGRTRPRTDQQGDQAR